MAEHHGYLISYDPRDGSGVIRRESGIGDASKSSEDSETLSEHLLDRLSNAELVHFEAEASDGFVEGVKVRFEMEAVDDSSEGSEGWRTVHKVRIEEPPEDVAEHYEYSDYDEVWS